MTWTRSTVTGLKCDDSIHKGDREFLIAHGVRVNAQQAIDAKGWRSNSVTGQHQCADCHAARTGRR